jgi:hypothetical protein
MIFNKYVVICVFLGEAQPRLGLKTGEDKRHFLAQVHIKFFRRPFELQSKKHHWKNYKFILYVCMYLFQIKKIINTY